MMPPRKQNEPIGGVMYITILRGTLQFCRKFWDEIMIETLKPKRKEYKVIINSGKNKESCKKEKCNHVALGNSAVSNV